ncbi:pleiotropic regulatory protein RsmS [Shewanella alkalitolerans]|uniref:pleiotropic regulatory protein RsmS n=1 Tax=Shewanella alkalitolerans TaxID=2864209 RepID=UPI001C658C97|nr:pleiotropic regulatory protein RsmS [Shewanella alkalitolerans]QYJ96630.1 pleiotropic regulatory protein RsmS [Shewanella alkalitolerans]
MTQAPGDSSTTKTALDDASDEIKLAVDLIYLLESHEIEPDVALAALEIVKQDLQRKLSKGI